MSLYYIPVLSSGQEVQFPWQINILRYNITVWPLADNTPRWMRVAERLYSGFCFVLLCYLDYANFYYLYTWYPNVFEIISCLSEYLSLLETHARVYHMAATKHYFKHFLERFYRDIYVEETVDPVIFNNIRLKTLPAILYSLAYVFTYLFFANNLVMGWWRGERNLMFKQAYHYDFRPLPIYLAHMVANFWVGLLVISQFFGEINILSTCILHIDARYKMLIRDMDQFVEQLLASSVAPSEVGCKFRAGILAIVKRNEELNRFVAELERAFTTRIFILFCFSSVLLCTILFNMSINGLSFSHAQFLTWTVAKLSELFIIGEFGSTLIATTDSLSSAYYLSRWHDVMLRSNDPAENVRVMKLVLMAMQLNNRPLSITGLKFFTLSNSAAISLIQGAFSYYTFLHAVG